MLTLEVLKAPANARRLEILNWLKDPDVAIDQILIRSAGAAFPN